MSLEETVAEEKNKNKRYCPARRISSQPSSTSEGKIIFRFEPTNPRKDI